MKAAFSLAAVCLLLAGCGTPREQQPPAQPPATGAVAYTLTWPNGSTGGQSASTEYDGQFLLTIQTRWDDLMESKRSTGYRRGDVVLQFRLMYDGRITDMKLIRNTAGLDLALVCEMAVLDPAPYVPFHTRATHGIRKDRPDVVFVLTFQYR